MTGYEGNDFKVYHRLYDAIDVTVVSDKNTVGYYDMDSTVVVSDAGVSHSDKIIPYAKVQGYWITLIMKGRIFIQMARLRRRCLTLR